MGERWFGLVEAALVFGLVMGLGGWQLWELKKLERARKAEHHGEAGDAAAGDAAAGNAEAGDEGDG